MVEHNRETKPIFLILTSNSYSLHDSKITTFDETFSNIRTKETIFGTDIITMLILQLKSDINLKLFIYSSI